MDIVKVGIIGVIGVLVAIQFKSTKPEFSILIGFCVCTLIFSFTISNFHRIQSVMNEFNQILGQDMAYITIVIKIIGITYICEFSGSICRDAGYGAIGNQIEVFGKLAILISGLPIMLALIDMIQSI